MNIIAVALAWFFVGLIICGFVFLQFLFVIVMGPIQGFIVWRATRASVRKRRANRTT